MNAPKKLAIYYGWPSTVNGEYSVAGAANVFGDYDLVVFGAGLESTSHGDHDNMVDIIDHQDMSNTECYGYVTMNQSEQSIKDKIDEWHSNVSGLAGIFLDEAGYDFGVSRSKQNTIVDYIHNKSSPVLKIFINAWDPDDVLSDAYDATYNPNSLNHKLNMDDWFLAESYVVSSGSYESETAWKNRADKLTSYSTDINIATITTPNSNGDFSQSMLDFAYYCNLLYKFDAFGWGEKNYSSAGGANSLLYRSRPTLPAGTKIVGSILNSSSNIYERYTNVGIHVNWSNHTKDTLLD